MAILQGIRKTRNDAEVSPVDLWDLLQDDWDRLWGWSRFPEKAGLLDRSVSPAVDVVETGDECVVWVDVPGLDKKDIELTLAGNVLTVRGEKKAPARSKGKEQVFRDETWTGNFQRSLSLPDTVDANRVSAEFRDGVLKVTVAKKAEHVPKTISVNVR